MGYSTGQVTEDTEETRIAELEARVERLETFIVGMAGAASVIRDDL